MNAQTPVLLSARLWRQLLHQKPIKFSLPDSDEFIEGTIDVTCLPDGSVFLSILHTGPQHQATSAQKLELTQAMVDDVVWNEEQKYFTAVFDS